MEFSRKPYLSGNTMADYYIGCQTGRSRCGRKFTLAMSVGNLMYSIALFGMRNFQVSDIAEEYRNGVYIASRLITCFVSVIIGTVYVLCMSYTAEQRWCIGIYCVLRHPRLFMMSMPVSARKYENGLYW